MKFRLLAGRHQDDSGTYERGAVFESKADLVARFNAPGAAKFERVDDETAVSFPPRNPHLEPAPAPISASSAPGGQVSTGEQVTVGTSQGNITGPKSVLDPSPASSHTRAELEKLTYPELRKLAEDEEVDLKGTTDKAKIVTLILGS